MAFEQEQRQARRILEGIEQGSMNASQSFGLISEADPALIYFIFTWLRESYPPSHPAAEGVAGRIVSICSAHPSVRKQLAEGKQDVIVTWFEDAYNYRDFRANEFVELIVEKLEG